MWNRTYQDPYERIKAVIKKGACIKFYNEKKPPIPQNRCIRRWPQNQSFTGKKGMNCPKVKHQKIQTSYPITFTSNSLFSVESNIEHETLAFHMG